MNLKCIIMIKLKSKIYSPKMSVQKKLLHFLKGVFTICQKMDIWGISAEMAFYFIFSLFPLIISLIGLLSLFSKNPQVFLDITSFIYSNFPENSAEFLKQNLFKLSTNPYSLSTFIFGIIFSIYSSSHVITTFIKGVNRAFQTTEKRSFFKIRAISIYLFLETSIILTFCFLLIIYGQDFFTLMLKVESYFIPKSFSLKLDILRWSSVYIILFILSSSLYYKSLNSAQKLYQVFPGASFFSLAWILSTILLGMYLNNFANLDLNYGTLGIMLSLLIWLFITAFNLLVGVSINAVLFNTKTNLFQKIKKKLLELRN